MQDNQHKIFTIKSEEGIYEKAYIEYVTITFFNIHFIENPSENVQLAAVENDWRAIHYIKNLTEGVILKAIEKSEEAIKFIKNPSQTVLDYHKFLWEM